MPSFTYLVVKHESNSSKEPNIKVADVTHVNRSSTQQEDPNKNIYASIQVDHIFGDLIDDPDLNVSDKFDIKIQCAKTHPSSQLSIDDYFRTHKDAEDKLDAYVESIKQANPGIHPGRKDNLNLEMCAVYWHDGTPVWYEILDVEMQPTAAVGSGGQHVATQAGETPDLMG